MSAAAAMSAVASRSEILLTGKPWAPARGAASRQPLVNSADRQAAVADQTRDAVIIGVRFAHRLLEDRRVGGDAGEPIVVDQTLQMSVVDDVARQEIEPDGRAVFRKLPQPVHASFHFEICSFATA